MVIGGPLSLGGWCTFLLGLLGFLSAAGIDIFMFTQHSTRSASAALQKSNQAATATQICKAAHWSLKSGTYRRFYDWVVLNT